MLPFARYVKFKLATFGSVEKREKHMHGSEVKRGTSVPPQCDMPLGGRESRFTFLKAMQRG